MDAAAVVLERLPGLRPEQQLELLLADAAAPVEVDAVHLVLDRPVADGGDVRHPTPAEVVEHRHLLGQAHRVVQRQEDDGDHDRQRRGARGDRGREHHRGGQVAVARRVVLADDRTHETIFGEEQRTFLRMVVRAVPNRGIPYENYTPCRSLLLCR